jgi:hypothetical protein
MSLARHVEFKRKTINACMALVGKPEGRGPLGRSKRRCENNIEIDLK